MCILNLYGPNTDDPIFFDDIFNKLQDIEEKIIMVGDYNIALNSTVDRDLQHSEGTGLVLVGAQQSQGAPQLHQTPENTHTDIQIKKKHVV